MDWANIKPLTENEALEIVSSYFSNHGFVPNRIETTELPNGQKAPDFFAHKKNYQFLCEVKSPALILDKTTGLYKWDTTFNKIRSHIHKAAKQFKSYDPQGKYPRVLVFTSNHPQLNWTSMVHNILGAVKFKDQGIRDYNDKNYVKDTKADLEYIGIFIWMQINYVDRKKIVELSFYVHVRIARDTHDLLKELKPYPEENIKKPNFQAL